MISLMGKIVAIVSSPRNDGNSNAIVDAITDGAMGLSTNYIDLFRVDRFHAIHGCKGCLACKKLGRRVQNDDVSDLLEKVRDADCVIFSTPMYFGSVCSQYKVVEDRMYSFLDSSRNSNLAPGKKAIIVVTCSSDVRNAELVAEKMAGVISAVGFEVVDTICYSDMGATRTAKDDKEIMTYSKSVGMRLRNT